MYRKPSHIIAFIFSIAIVVPLLATVFLQGWQVQLKRQARYRLEEELMEVVTLPLDEVVWEKKEKEININGLFFDIKAYTIKNGMFIATGVYDEEETRLLNLLQKQGDRSGKTVSLIQLLLAGQSFVSHLQFITLTEGPQLFQNPIPSYSNHYLAPCLAISKPPPRSLPAAIAYTF